MIRAAELQTPAAPVPYYQRRIAEIARERTPEPDEMRTLNSRFHYARAKYRAAFDLFWHRADRAVHLRVVTGRRLLPIPEGSERIGRYDRAATWETVKADFLTLIGGTP